MRIIGISSAALVAAMLVAQPARADGVYVTINGQHGRIQGPAQYGGRLLGLAFNETSASPSSQHGGAGHVLPSSYEVTFEWGAALPQLQQAIVNHEPLDVKFEFFTQSGGQDQVYYVMTMTGSIGKSLKLNYDASASPVATMTAEFTSTQVSESTPPSSSGSGAAPAPSAPASTSNGRLMRATPAINLAQGRSAMRIAASDPVINDAWITVSAPQPWHNDVAGPPAKTAEVRKFELDLAVPTDLATGHAIGQNQHHPIEFTKALGPSSADFQSALQHNTALSQVMLEFGSRSNMHPVYSITLGTVQVSKDQQSMNGGAASESVELRWQHLTTSDAVTHSSATDSWTSSN